MVHNPESALSDGDGSTDSFSFLQRFLDDSETRHPRADYDCCCIISTFFGNLLCLRKMKRRTRVVILWVWLTAVCLTTSLVLRFQKYTDQSIAASSHDMRTMDDISTDFCETVTIRSSDDIDVYLFPTYPAISDQLHRYYMRKTTVIAVNRYEYLGFYLIKGSKVRVRSCISGYTSFVGSVDVYIFQGKENRKEWESDSNCNNCYTYYTNIYSCITSNHDTYLLSIAETDEYYFLFSNQDNTRLTFQVEIRLDRAVYNIESTIDHCLHTKLCTFNLVSRSPMVSAYYVRGVDRKEVTVTYSCGARPWLYISAFFLVPAFFGVCASLALIYCCRKKRRNDRGNQQQRIWSTHSFNNGDEGQNNQIFMEPPPSYDDVISRRV